MNTVPEAVAIRRTGHTRRGLQATAVQRLFAIALAVFAVALLATHQRSREVEAQIASSAISRALHIDTWVDKGSTLVTVGGGSQHIFSIDISFACSVALLLTPFLLIAAGLLFTGRSRIFRTLLAVGLGGAALIALNATRFVLIASMTREGDLEGFGWAHSFYGSALVLVGLVIIEVVYVYAVTRTPNAARRSEAAE